MRGERSAYVSVCVPLPAASPISFSVTGLSADAYTLTVMGWDETGKKTTAQVPITITSSPPGVHALRIVANV